MSIPPIRHTLTQSPPSAVETNAGTEAAAPASSTGASNASSKATGAGAPTPSYTVSISSAARALVAEASETSVQTAQEAGKGDQQALRLQAKEAAAKAASAD